MSIDRIQPYFGFSAPPFGAGLPPGSLHRFASHAEATARISYLVDSEALGLLTGEVGAGKTTALRAAVAALDPSRHTVIYLANPAIGSRGLYTEIVSRLGGEPRFHKAMLIPQAQDLPAREREERKKRVVVIVDEAHLLSAEQLEELRLLTNSEMDSVRPFAGILLGQPQLRRRLRMGILRGAGSADRAALRAGWHGRRRIGRLPLPPPEAGRPRGPALLRRRGHAAARALPGNPQGAQQPRHPGADRDLRRREVDRRRVGGTDGGGGGDGRVAARDTTPMRSPAFGRAFSWLYVLTLSGAGVFKVSVALQRGGAAGRRDDAGPLCESGRPGDFDVYIDEIRAATNPSAT